jgi:hypothetical protein
MVPPPAEFQSTSRTRGASLSSVPRNDTQKSEKRKAARV